MRNGTQNANHEFEKFQILQDLNNRYRLPGESSRRSQISQVRQIHVQPSAPLAPSYPEFLAESSPNLELFEKGEDRQAEVWNELAADGDPRKNAKQRRKTVPNIGTQLKSLRKALRHPRHLDEAGKDKRRRKSMIWLLLGMLLLLFLLIALVTLILTNLRRITGSRETVSLSGTAQTPASQTTVGDLTPSIAASTQTPFLGNTCLNKEDCCGNVNCQTLQPGYCGNLTEIWCCGFNLITCFCNGASPFCPLSRPTCPAGTTLVPLYRAVSNQVGGRGNSFLQICDGATNFQCPDEWDCQ